jgi:hypothetical protein
MQQSAEDTSTGTHGVYRREAFKELNQEGVVMFLPAQYTYLSVYSGVSPGHYLLCHLRCRAAQHSGPA